MMPFSEEELIAYHLHELSPLRARAVRRALERDPELAVESEAIAETLRVFSSHEPVPQIDAAMLERSWQSLRPSLAVLSPARRSYSWRWAFAAGAGFAAVMAVVAVLFLSHYTVSPVKTADTHAPKTSSSIASVSPTEVPAVISELHDRQPATQRYNGRPGPLTTAPVDAIADDPGMAAHLDRAERVLTEVSHEDGPLPVEERTEVHHLLLQNAVYQRTAQERGDFAAANVMDDLGRVLISLDAEPQESAHDADAVRLQVRMGSVLFDLRILHHNERAAD
jgi:anti-sigma factor RsiW